jgi:predicted nucleic acid-binding protein
VADRSFYVETSVWGMVSKGQPKEMRRASLQFLRRGRRFFVSTVVLDEISAAPESDRGQILVMLESVRPVLVEVTAEAVELAGFYVASGILPARKMEDALHVALATTHEMDVLVSWNHRHMANVRKTEQYRGANLMRGFSKSPLILTPLEVLYE